MKRILDETTIGALTVITLCVVMFATVKALVGPNTGRTFKGVMVSFFVAIPVGLIAGLVAFEWGLGQFTSCLVASFATLIGEQIVLSVVNSKLDFSSLIKRAAENLVDKMTK